MKTKGIFITGTAILMLSMLIGCGGDNSSNPLGGCNGVAWGQEISDELTAVSEAGANYGEDPTLQKCELYKDALRDYLDALKGVSSACIPAASEADYQEAIAEAEQDIDDIDCTEETGG